MNNKHKIEFILYMIFGLILMATCVTAYSSTNLKAYYSMETLNLTDNTGINNLSITTSLNYNIIPAKIGNGLYQNGTITGSTQYNGSTFDFSSSSWSINMWLNHSSSTNSDYIISVKNDTGTSFFTLRHVLGNLNTGSKGSSAINELNVSYSTTAYSMITIEYHLPTKVLYLYINGTLSGSATNITFRPSSTKLYIGISYYDVIDELSIWDINLNPFDLLTLYNTGSGYTYVQTLSGTNITIGSKCIDEYTYCTDVGINSFSEYYCNSYTPPIMQFCSGGCLNDICYISGEADCAIVGQTKCYDSTNYLTCDDSDGDGFLDFKTPTTCALGTYCVDYFNLAVCENVTANGVHNEWSMIVTPYAVNSENATYIIDPATNTINAISTYLIHGQKFYTTGTNFISRICNYTEYETQSYNTAGTIVNETTYTLSNAYAQNSILRLDINPAAYDNGTIQILSQAGTSMSTIKYYRNTTARSLCIYDNSDVTIICDYDYTGSDTLKNLFIEYTYDITRLQYTMKYYFNRTYAQTKYTYPLPLSTNNIGYIRITANGTQFRSYTISKIPQFKQFEYTKNNSPTIAVCDYASVGIYKVRTYGNNNGIQDYGVYRDYNVNIKGLGMTQEQIAITQNAGARTPLSSNTKLWLSAFFIITSIAVIGSGLGVTTHNAGIASIAGLFGGLIAAVILSALLWLPIYIMILIAVLDVIFIVIIFKTIFLSSGGVG